jgi:hypothetical protein
MNTNKNNNSQICLESIREIQLNDIMQLIISTNIQNNMNKEQSKVWLTELENEHKTDAQLIEGLRNAGTPSAQQTIAELEEKGQSISRLIENLQSYMSLKGIDLSGLKHDRNRGNDSTPKELKARHVTELIMSYPLRKPFGINEIRDLACDTYSALFPKTKREKFSFYGTYNQTVQALIEKNKIEIVQPGKGRRATIFQRISEVESIN